MDFGSEREFRARQSCDMIPVPFVWGLVLGVEDCPNMHDGRGYKS